MKTWEEIEAESKKYEAPAIDKNGVEVRKGDRVRVPKGVMFQSTHPKYRGRETQGFSIHETAGTRTVKVERIDRYRTGKHQICWAGTGGYWFFCLVEDVEKIQ